MGREIITNMPCPECKTKKEMRWIDRNLRTIGYFYGYSCDNCGHKISCLGPSYNKIREVRE